MASLNDKLTVQVFGPVGVIVPVFMQLEDHPPNLTPVCAGAVSVTVLPSGNVAVQTDLPAPAPGPQLITAGVPVAEGAVTSQLPPASGVLGFSPSLYTVSVDSSCGMG